MSLLGGITGALSGGSAGGLLGALAGGAVGAAMPTTGYKDPKASGHGMGYQAAGYDYATAQRLKMAALQPGAPYPPIRPQIVGGPAPLATSLVGGLPQATSLVGASALNPLGQIIAGAGAAAFTALSPAQQAANNATALYNRLTGRGTTATGKKRRRMNPMNIRAARRAIRRIRGARRILMRIERSMPKARTHHRRSVR